MKLFKRIRKEIDTNKEICNDISKEIKEITNLLNDKEITYANCEQKGINRKWFVYKDWPLLRYQLKQFNIETKSRLNKIQAILFNLIDPFWKDDRNQSIFWKENYEKYLKFLRDKHK